jgi:D-alanyl-D-alanine carboxypeptidase/D-alanyl-D-alanine carboxypeptidase (penicillin-binding protein 5/6)
LKKLLLILLSSLLLIANITTVNASSPKLNVDSYVLMDSSTGRILDSMNPDSKLYPASTTKIMTAILALEKGRLDQMMTASEAAICDIGPGGSNAGIPPGEKLSMKVLMDVLLVNSANDAANIIAENLAPTRKDFIDLMNEKAVQLGAIHTHFVNTNGIYDPDHYTTTADMALIASYAMKIPEFRNIVLKKSVVMPPNRYQKKAVTLYNTNNLLYYKNDNFTITGIKTGFINQSGHNLVSSAINKDGMELIAVVFGSKYGPTGRTDFANSYSLLKYGFSTYSIKSIADSGSIIKNISVIDSDSGKNLKLLAASPIVCAMPNDKVKWNIGQTFKFTPNIKAPISKGSVLGTVTFTSNGVPVRTVNLIAESSVNKSFGANVRDFFGNLINSGLILKIILLVIFFVLLRFVLKRISRLRRLRKYKRDY